jgi:solute:Na+ symporter, SSS family
LSLHLGLLLAYSLFQVALGLWMGRNVKTSGEFFVAGRRLGPGLLLATLVAANIGAGSTVGATGLGYRDGLSAWWWVGSAAIGSFVLAFTVGPHIRRIAAERDLRTVGDFLEYRYGREVRGVIATLLWLGTLAILAGQLIAMGVVLNAVAGLPAWVGVVLGGTVMTAYFTAGGLMTSARIHLIQLVVELLVYATLVPVALAAAGGWASVVARTPSTPGYWSLWQGGSSGWVYLALLAPAFVVSPGLLQKVYGARDDRAVRLGVGGNAVLLLLFAMVPAVLGMIARALHPNLPRHEMALPTLLLQDLPPIVGALGLAAVFSTEVNTADAILFMLSTSLSQDLYRRFLNPEATDAQVLRVARGAAVAGGVLGMLLALVFATVIGALSIFYTLLSVCLFVPVVAGLYSRRVGTPEALAAIVAGVAMVAAVELGRRAGGGWLGSLSAAQAGLLASAAACAFVAIARRAYHRAPEVS